RLVARREGDELTFQVNELSSVVYREVFPVSRSEQGVFGLCWDSPAALTLLRATGLARSAAPSPLEEGDALYAVGKFAEAQAYYREQSVSATEATFSQEARYKEGLCLVGLKRTDEAKELFRVLSQEPGDRWVIAATCQLWLLELQHGQTEEADRLFVYLTVRYPYATLARLMPYDVGKRIIPAYFERTSGTALLQFDPACVGYLEKVMALQDLLGDSPYERFTTRLMLARTCDLAGQRDRAIGIARELVRGGDPWDYQMNTQAAWLYVWMMGASGRCREGLDEIERLIRERPSWGERYIAQLYIDRACLRARLGEWLDAERDLDGYFRRTDRPLSYLDDTRAYLMQGFLRERRGDAEGALESWRAGYALGRPGGRKGSPFTTLHVPAYGQDYLQFVMVGSLAERLTEEDVKGVLDETLGAGGQGALPPVLAERMTETLAPVMCAMWRTPRGREYARQIMFREVPFVDAIRLPGVLMVTDYLKRYAFDDKVSEDQDRLLVKLGEDVWDEVRGRRLGKTGLMCMFFAWKGTTGFLGWGGVKDRLSPALRGPAAWVLGHRYLRLGRPDDAVTFFTTAAELAPPDSTLRRLAADALKRLAPKTPPPGPVAPAD
ncbi:MAG TPA: tetratricopeptide repeat protein, partial [Planctomycetota bacterium]|nr:tetratricopeptide repeat protein [Planctomycetota bacterium]